MTGRILIGAEGWDHDAWQGVLYPEDLPADWRLAFYALHYPMVVLSWSQVRAVDVSTLDAWAADTNEAFRFIIRSGQSAVPQGLGQVHEVLGCRLAGVLLDKDPDAAGAQAQRGYPLRSVDGALTTGRVILVPLLDIRARANWLTAQLAQCPRDEPVYGLVPGPSPALRALDELANLIELLGL